MANQQHIDLDSLRSEAQEIHKSIQAGMKLAETAVRVELFKKAVATARKLEPKVKEAEAVHQAERKRHLHEAEMQLAALVALHTGAEVKHKVDDMLEASSKAVKHITEAIALERRPTTKSSTFN